MQTEEGYQPVFFEPRPLKNLLLIDEMESLSPIMDLKACISPQNLPRDHTLLQWLVPSLCDDRLLQTMQNLRPEAVFICSAGCPLQLTSVLGQTACM